MLKSLTAESGRFSKKPRTVFEAKLIKAFGDDDSQNETSSTAVNAGREQGDRVGAYAFPNVDPATARRTDQGMHDASDRNNQNLYANLHGYRLTLSEFESLKKYLRMPCWTSDARQTYVYLNSDINDLLRDGFMSLKNFQPDPAYSLLTNFLSSLTTYEVPLQDKIGSIIADEDHYYIPPPGRNAADLQFLRDPTSPNFNFLYSRYATFVKKTLFRQLSFWNLSNIVLGMMIDYLSSVPENLRRNLVMVFKNFMLQARNNVTDAKWPSNELEWAHLDGFLAIFDVDDTIDSLKLAMTMTFLLNLEARTANSNYMTTGDGSMGTAGADLADIQSAQVQAEADYTVFLRSLNEEVAALIERIDANQPILRDEIKALITQYINNGLEKSRKLAREKLDLQKELSDTKKQVATLQKQVERGNGSQAGGFMSAASNPITLSDRSAKEQRESMTVMMVSKKLLMLPNYKLASLVAGFLVRGQVESLTRVNLDDILVSRVMIRFETNAADDMFYTAFSHNLENIRERLSEIVEQEMKEYGDIFTDDIKDPTNNAQFILGHVLLVGRQEAWEYLSRMLEAANVRSFNGKIRITYPYSMDFVYQNEDILLAFCRLIGAIITRGSEIQKKHATTKSDKADISSNLVSAQVQLREILRVRYKVPLNESDLIDFMNR